MLTSEVQKALFYKGLFVVSLDQEGDFLFREGGSRSAGVTLREWLFASADVINLFERKQIEE